MSAAYTDQQLARIQELTDKGLAASDIAERCSEEFGRAITKNAICGLWNRRTIINPLSAEYRKHRGARSGGTVNKIKAKRGLQARNGWRGMGSTPTAPKLAFAMPRADDKARVGLFDLTNETCRFPIGEPGKEGFGYCGLPEADFLGGQPYCPGHHARTRIPLATAKKDRRRTAFLEAAE